MAIVEWIKLAATILAVVLSVVAYLKTRRLTKPRFHWQTFNGGCLEIHIKDLSHSGYLQADAVFAKFPGEGKYKRLIPRTEYTQKYDTNPKPPNLVISVRDCLEIEGYSFIIATNQGNFFYRKYSILEEGAKPTIISRVVDWYYTEILKYFYK
jgi:hypothetical protein